MTDLSQTSLPQSCDREVVIYDGWARPGVKPVLSGVAVFFVLSHFGVLAAQGGCDKAALGGTIAQVGSTMMGFLLAAAAVLASINHVHLVKMMRLTGHYQDLLYSTVWAGFLFMLCTAVGGVMAFGFVGNDGFVRLVAAVNVAAFVSMVFVAFKLYLVLTSLRD